MKDIDGGRCQEPDAVQRGDRRSRRGAQTGLGVRSQAHVSMETPGTGKGMLGAKLCWGKTQ